MPKDLVDNETDRIIAEWLGKCWHRDFTERFYCEVCPPYEASSEWMPDPFYTASLDVVREAELKAVEVFGELMYWDELERGLERPTAVNAITAPASARAAAVRRLIEESK